MPSYDANRIVSWRIAALCGAALVARPALVEAADEHGGFALKGVAYSSCAQFVAAIEEPDRRLDEFGGWLDGYMSAYNRLAPDTVNVSPWQRTKTLLGIIGVLCQERPNLSYAKAVEHLLRELHPHRLRRTSDIVPIAVGSRKATLYREVVVTIQSRLSERGLLSQAPSGEYDQETRTALAQYQKEIGVEGTGFPDQQTLFNLLIK